MRTSIYLVLLSSFIGCSEDAKDMVEMKVYDGPVKQAQDVVMTYSEETLKKVVLRAKTLKEFKNGDREFPNGLYVEFYDEEGTLSSTLKSDQGFYSKVDNQWKATGNVIVKSFENDQQLNTEELFWKPDQEKIFTEKFVTIRLEKEVIYGEGFESNQDFTSYDIKNTKGVFYIE